MRYVYLCQGENGYVHCVFDNIKAAMFYCEKHPHYKVIERCLLTYQPD